jgi:3-oxoacyl-[acyl-carrier-protein] synthase II
MADRRVAITGLGVVTPAGIGIEALWQNLLAGKSGVKTVSFFDASKFTCNIAGQLDDFSARNYVPKDYRKAVKVMARDIEIAVATGDLAFRDSGIVTKGIDPANVTIPAKRLGCNIGAGLLCSDLDELGMAVNSSLDNGKFSLKLWGNTGMNNLTPLWLLKYLPNMLSCHVTIIHGAEGPSNCITCGDASGHMAVGEAARYITRETADVAIAGGAESKLNPMGLLRQELLKRLCTTRTDSAACRPFDVDHAGTVIGEGGGLLVLEELGRAQSRNARIHAEMAGFGGACDPNAIDVLAPTCGNLHLAVKSALRDAGISPEQIGLIVAHGTGVPSEDKLEVQAWRSSLGGVADQVPAVSITGATGSLFAGSGGVSLAVAARALAEQTVPPTVNFTRAADGCNLNFSSQARQAKMEYAVVGSYTVGGQSAACVLKRYQA